MNSIINTLVNLSETKVSVGKLVATPKKQGTYDAHSPSICSCAICRAWRRNMRA